jgi:tetratricopeptide (TPR) repeat protein
MEPFSLAIYVLSIATSSIIGSRADNVFCKVMSTVTERLRQGGLPVNHDLQRAVYKAYLQATMGVCEAYLKSLGVAPSRWRRDPRVVMRPSDELRWLDAVRHAIRQELKKLPDTDYVPPSTEVDKQVELLLQPKSATAEQRVDELRVVLHDGLLSELREKHGEPPARLRKMVQHGWEDLADDGTTVHLEWFDLLCAFFVYELKTNEQLRSIFESKLLAELTVEGISLTSLQAQYEKLGKEMVRRLERLDAHFDQLRAEQTEGFMSLQERLDEILPQLLLLSDVTEQQRALQEMLQVALRELSRSLLYERYAGIEVANRVEKLVNDYITLYVGRENEIARLDSLLNEKPCGLLTVTAKAGFGKTALLANWITAWKGEGYFIAYHFFSHRDDISRLDDAYRNLLRQIFIYYEIKDEPLPNNEQILRDTLVGILQERKARADEPLVIVLDALDEAERPFYPPFPEPLPEGMFVIVSARADKGEVPEYLSNWADGAIPLHLTRLPRVAIADYLRRAGEGELAEFAVDGRFVAEIDHKTEGFPLYLRYMTEELVQEKKKGQDVCVKLAQTPKGFKEYVSQQLKHLDKLDLSEQTWNFFALLAVAKGALHHKEIKAITGMRDRDLRQMSEFWQVTRWLSITGEGEYSTYAFTHHLLGETFEGALSDDAEAAEEKLLVYCADWQEHLSPYALQRYAEHLLDIGRTTTLYSLARDEEFRRAQAKVFPDNPYLQLRTVQMALQGAADSDDAAAMAEFLILHARQLEHIITQDSPLDALRGDNLNRAWKLADLYDIEHCTLWYLLLAWELKDTNRLEEAQTTLEHLQKKELPSLSDWQEDYATYLLAHAFEIDENAFIALHHKLLSNEYRALCQNLIDRGHFAVARETAHDNIYDLGTRVWVLKNIAIAQAQANEISEALKTAQEIENPGDWLEALADIAVEQAKENQKEGAYATFAFALKIAQEKLKDNPYDLAGELKKIATAQIKADLKEEARATLAIALETTQEIENPLNRLEPLADIAVEQAKENQKEGAYATFASALKIVQKELKDPYDQAGELGIIATAQIKADLKKEARATLAIALETAQEIDDPKDKTWILQFIAPIQVKADLEEEARATLAIALETAQEIDDPKDHSDALKDHSDALKNIAAALAQANKFSEALKTAQEIEDAYNLAEALKEIAVAQAQASEFSEAFKTVKRIGLIQGIFENSWLDAMKAIVAAQAQANEFQEALKTVQEIKVQYIQAEAMKEIATAQAKIDQTKEARGTFADALKTREKNEIGMWSGAMRYIAIAQAKVNQTKEVATFADALKTAQKIEEPYNLAEALKEIAVVQADAEQIEEARGTFADALETAQKIKQPLWRARVLGDVAAAQADAELIEEARGTFADALETGLKNIGGDRLYNMQSTIIPIVKVIKNITSEQAQADMFSFALETAQKIEDPWKRAKIFEYIVATQSQADMFVGVYAYEYELRIEDIESTAEALRNIATTQDQTGKFSDALETAQKIENLRGRGRVLGYIAAAQTQADMFSDALKTALKIENLSDRGRVLGYIAAAQTQADKFSDALKTALKIENLSDRVRVLGYIAAAQAKADKTKEAHATFAYAFYIATDIAPRDRKGVLEYIATVQAWAYMFSDALKTTLSIGDLRNRAEAMKKIAASQAEAVKTDEALATFADALEIAQKIKYPDYRESVLWEIATAQAQVGFSEQAVRTAEIPFKERNIHLPRIAEILAEVDDKKHFKQLLIPCASYLDSAFSMCGDLAQLYPEQAAGVAEKMLEFR